MARTKKDPSQKKKPGPKPREKRSEVRMHDLHIRVSEVEKDALARKAKMKKQRIGTPFSNCSFEMAFDNEMVIRRILVSFV